MAGTSPEWRRRRLGEVFRIQHGYAFKGAHFSDSGKHIVLTPGNFRPQGGIISRGNREKYYSAPFPERFLLREGDLLVVMTDLKQSAPILGSPGFVPEDDRYLHNQRLGKIVDLDVRQMDGRFLYYLFLSDPVREQIRATATGATVRHTAPERIYKVETVVPGVKTQRKIASILSAYDDLIENNLRRIKILEEMARAIYQEWFVNFRFPGHKKVKFVDSPLGKIPEGWAVRRMAEAAQVVDCSHARKPPRIDASGGLLLHVWNVGDGGKLDLSTQYLISDEDYRAWTKRIEVAGGDCVMTKTGRVGAVGQIPAGLRAAIGRNIVAIRWRAAPTYLLHYLLSPHKDREVTLLTSRGTIMESLHVKAVEALRIGVPTVGVLEAYENTARPLQRLIEVLVAQNGILRASRDLLLPRLVSGELDVSDLEIETGDVAA